MSDPFQAAANAANAVGVGGVGGVGGGELPERYKHVVSQEDYAKMVARLKVDSVRRHLESRLLNAEKKRNHVTECPVVYDTNVPGLLVGSPGDRSLVP